MNADPTPEAVGPGEPFRSLIENSQDVGVTLQALIASCPHAIIVMDPDGRVRLWNPAAEATFGWTEAEVVGRPMPLVPEDKAEEHRRMRERVLAGESFQNVEVTRRRRDGSPVHISVSTSPLRAPDGSVTGIMSVSTDVTARKHGEDAMHRQSELLDQAHAELRRKEEHFRALTEHATDLVTITDAAGRILYESPSIETMLGYTQDELTGRSIFDLVHPDDVEGAASAFADLLHAEGKSLAVEVRFRHRDGSWRWLGARGTNLLHLPAVRGVIVNSRDVTERKVAEEMHRRLAAIVQYSDEAIVSQDLEGRFLSWNRGAEQIYGYSAQETVGRTGGFLIPEDYRCEAVVSRERISRGELVENFETVRIRKDGARIHVSLTASPIRDEAGKVVGISVISRDVTDKKRFAETLAASNERYRLVSRATSDTIWDWDVLAGTVEWNEGLAATFGYSLGEVEHTPEWWLDRVHEEDRERVGAALEQAIAGGGEFWSDEYRLRRADGSFAFVLDRGYVLRDGEGHPLRMIGSTSDMTARNEAEQELLRAKEVAEDANRAKSEFLSRMSHELRTPLNSVIGFASVLHKNKAGNLREQDRGYLERILANGKHLLGLINDILDLSKIEAGKVEVELAPTALDTLVRDTLTALRGARGPEVDLRMDVPESLAPLEADPGKLKQVLINLVGNALKFTERGVVRVAVSADPLTLRPYRIDVSDTGIGIPADRLAAIFQPFEQAESGTARRFEGTGLGLAICSSLCGLLGYELTVRSEPGVGSTFSIRLGPEPETDASGAASIVFRSSPDDAGEPGAEPLPLAGKRVMVIDDEADACIVLSHYLEECGCDVLATTSATQAIRIAEWFAPDLITLDLMMPARSGVELFEQLKQHPVLGGVPVLVVSVLADQGVGISGVIEMLTKPVSRERLQQTLDRIFEARPVRVLVIDGDSGTREQMALSLEAEGVAVQTAANLSQALGALRSAHPDFVVLNPTPTDEGGAPLFAVTAREPTPAELRRLRENPLAPLRSTDG